MPGESGGKRLQLVPASSEQLILPTFTLPSVGDLIICQQSGATYQMEGRLGEGAFGVVYACTDSWNNQLAAKILKPRDQPYEAIRQSALDEFQKLLLLRHPNITHVFDAFEFKHTFYIITERCDEPIKSFLTVPDFNGSVWIKAIARCLLQAVHFIHLNGHVHQDIHLGNVFYRWVKDELIKSDGIEHSALIFKLGDLGITKLVQDMNPENTILAEWMWPPEFLRPAEFGIMDHRVDIYHCGLLFLQILYGRELAFSRKEILDGEPRQMALQLPPPYNFALEKALRRHVQFRTERAAELWRDLNSSATAPAAISGLRSEK